MDEQLVFRLLFISIYAVFAGVRIYYRSQNIGRASEKEYTQKTKATIVLMVAILGYFLTMGLWIVFPQFIVIFQIPLPSVIRWFGGGLQPPCPASRLRISTWSHVVRGVLSGGAEYRDSPGPESPG